MHAGRHDRRRGTRRAAPATATSSGPSTCPTTPDSDVEVSISYASDDVVQRDGVFVDDIDGLAPGRGSTSFEDDGDTLDGWTVPGAPEGSPRQRERLDRRHRRRPRRRPSARSPTASFARQPEIIALPLRAASGRYPCRAAGGIVDDVAGPRLRARDPDAADLRAGLLRRAGGRPTRSSSTSSRTSGPATAWPSPRGSTSGSTRASRPTPSGCGASARASAPRRRSSTTLATIPADDPFWQVVDRRPRGRTSCSTCSVYYRGAMTLHALRHQIGDDDFFRLLRRWVRAQRRRQRHDAAVHRARRAHLRPGPRRLLPDVAVHAGEARRDRARGPAQALRRRREGGAGGDQEGEEALGSRASIHASTSANTCACSGSWWISWNRPS